MPADPTVTARPRFDAEALRRLAGDRSFARGLAYHQAGQVAILSLDAKRVLARVTGTEEYRVVLTGRGARIDGECSCPAFEDRGFCKHMVATALAANAAGNGEVDALTRIGRHLRAQDKDTLVALLIDLAERDAALFRRLDLDSAATVEDDAVLFARFAKAIDDATRTGGYVAYRAARSWAAQVEVALDAVAALVPSGRATLALRLIDHAWSRIDGTLDEVDDSDGDGIAVLERLADMHLQACRDARPDPRTLARSLYVREMHDEWGAFHRAAERYAEILGEPGLAEFRRLATADWEVLPCLAAGRRNLPDDAVDRRRLAAILDFFAVRDGDLDARIAIRAKTLARPGDYLALARFCHSAGRAEDALRWAEDGLWLFEDDAPDAALVDLAVELLLAAGQPGRAEGILWRAFSKRPHPELYTRLRQLGGETARDRAIAWLRDRAAGDPPANSWRQPADMLIRVLMLEALFAEAWEAVRRHGASDGLRQALAEVSEAAYPAEALAVYTGRIDALVAAGGNGNYAEACRLIGRMDALRPPAEAAAHVAELRLRFKARRNFVKMLAE